MRLKKLLIIGLFILPWIKAISQSAPDVPAAISDKYEALAEKLPSEIVYVLTNKDIYETGEDLWFKAFILDSRTLHFSGLNHTLYVQLLNEKTREPVFEEKFEIRDSCVNGRILLKKEFITSDYILTAFTSNSIARDSSDYYSFRKITLVSTITNYKNVAGRLDKLYYNDSDSIRLSLRSLNTSDSSEVIIKATLRRQKKIIKVVTDTLISGNRKQIDFGLNDLSEGSTISLDITNKDFSESTDIPVPCRHTPIQFNVFPEGGKLVDGIKSRVAFKAINVNGEPVDIKGTLFENDIPKLEFKSQIYGMGYFELTPALSAKYKIRLNDPGTDSIYSMPLVSNSGITMRLLSLDSNELVFLISGSKADSAENITVRIQSRGIVYGVTMFRLKDNIRIRIPVKDIPQGIAEVTLIDEMMRPIAGRLVFLNPEKKVIISTELTDKIFPTRGKVSLKIKTKDQTGRAVPGIFALTVYDKLYYEAGDSSSIFTNLYLTSQIKGRIYNPGHYFNESNKNRFSDLDLLLMTQGWRNYLWSEEGISKIWSRIDLKLNDGVSGTVTGTRKKILSEGQATVMVFSPQTDSTNIFIPIDSAGEFKLESGLLHKWSPNPFYLKAVPSSSGKEKVEINIEDPFVIINGINQDKRFISSLHPLYENTIIQNYTNYHGLRATVIREVQIKGKKGFVKRDKYLGKLDSIARENSNNNSNTDYVCRYGILNCRNHPFELDNIKPVKGHYYLDPITFISQIYIGSTTSQPSLTDQQFLKLHKLLKLMSYSQEVEFYSPVYDIGSDIMNVPDYRNALIWSPNVKTDSNGEAVVTFYCSDLNTEFIGRIEGVGGNGLPGSSGFEFKVRKMKLSSDNK